MCYSLRSGALDGLVPHLLDRHRVTNDGRDQDIGDPRGLVRVGERAEDLDARVLAVRVILGSGGPGLLYLYKRVCRPPGGRGGAGEG